MNIVVIISYVWACYCITEIQSYRLPTDVIPTHYSIRIHPHLENETFDGEVTIYVRCRTVLEKIVLHSWRLNITQATLNQIGVKLTYDYNEMIDLEYVNDIIQPGEHVIHLKYRGAMQRNGSGFLSVPSNYQENQGYLYLTDYHPTGARAVFPCFDEPYYKAEFDLRLVVPNDTYKAYSVLPQISKFETSIGIVYDFAQSVLMSPHFLTFAISTYPTYEESYMEDKRKVPLGIIALKPGKAINNRPLNFIRFAMKYYAEYTKINYPMSRLDMTEYDRDFSQSMKNWGLVALNKGMLSTNLGIYDDSQIRLAMYRVAGHCWFGNIVTNDWWNDIWLQEGLTTYMAYRLYRRVTGIPQPERTFFFDGFNETNQYPSARAIVDYYVSPELMARKFEIASNKGAAVFEMLENVIDTQKFQKVVQLYLKKHSYSTVTTNDFITALEEVVSDINLRSFIESYIYQTKFPLISVREENKEYILTQEPGPSIIEPLGSGQKWTVPITYKTNSKGTTTVWFDKVMDSLTIKPPISQYIQLNGQEIGLYRVNYSEDLWQKLIRQYPKLTNDECRTLVNDAFYAFKFHLIGCDILFEIFKKAKPHHRAFFVGFHDLLRNRFKCNGFQEESIYLDVYMNIIYKEIMKSQNETTRTNQCQIGEGLLQNEEQYKILQKCVKWIQDNKATLPTS